MKIFPNHENNNNIPHFELREGTNPSHIFHSKEDFSHVEEKLLNENNSLEMDSSPPPLKIKDLIKEEEKSGDEEEKKQELYLIGKDKEEESLKESSKLKESEDSIILLPPMPNHQNNLGQIPNRSSVNSNSHSINGDYFQNGIYLKKKFSVEKKKIGFSTIMMRRDQSLFNNLDEREIKSSESWNKMFSSNSENFNFNNEIFEKPTNKNVMNELENIERHIILKRKVENFIILFNDKPEDGIEYLIFNEMVIK